jgi:hypothetical protein
MESYGVRLDADRRIATPVRAVRPTPDADALQRRRLALKDC